MQLIDRYLIRRFLTNFVILFLLIYLLATSIDIILQLDEFMQAVESIHGGEDVGFLTSVWTLAHLAVNFHGPRVFQLYAYLLGLTSVGAMGFTLAQMQRHRELVALLASGMSLYRVAWPILVAAFGLNMMHLINSNVILPSLAPMLIRTHGDLETGAPTAFAIPITADGNGALLHSPAFHREAGVLESPTILVRDKDGITQQRISATKAVWDEGSGAWILTDGEMIGREPSDTENTTLAGSAGADLVFRTSIDRFETDLSPEALTVRRYAQFAQMLGPSQIEELLATPGAVDFGSLARIKYGRYSVVLTNMLMLLLTLPFYLLREPANLLKKSIWCAIVAMGTMFGSFIGMEVDLPGFKAVANVFLPVIILIPLSLFSLGLVRT